MPEEIADLTGSRIEDKPYSNNVVFNTDGLNELLSHIKNYPVVDIDYISKNDFDEINTDKKVWETYTDNTPCIKVVYGDSENLNGNLSPDDLEEIRRLKRKIALLNQVKNIYNKYGAIESEYVSLIQNIQTELKNIIKNICTIYHRYLSNSNPTLAPTSTMDNGWSGSYYDILKDVINDDNPEERKFEKGFKNNVFGENVNGLYYKIIFNIENILNNLENMISSNAAIDSAEFYKVTYSERDNEGVNCLPQDEDNGVWYVTPIMKKQNNIDITKIDWRGPEFYTSLSSPWDNNVVKTQYLKYNDLLAETIQLLDYKYFVTSDTRPQEGKIYYEVNEVDGNATNGYKIAEVTDTFDSNIVYYERTEDGQNHIRNLLKKYISYIRNARINKYEEIRQLLIHVARDTIKEEDIDIFANEITEFGDTAYNRIADYINREYINEDDSEFYAQINQIMDEATAGKYKLVEDTSGNPDAATQYYIIDEYSQRYIPVTFDNEESFAEGVNYYTLEEGAYPAIYGYKYVKAGNDITWESNNLEDEHAPDTVRYIENPSEDTQDYGTFRVTINSKVYEVPIKGFGDSDEDNLKSDVAILPNSEYNPVEDDIFTTTETYYITDGNGNYYTSSPFEQVTKDAETDPDGLFKSGITYYRVNGNNVYVSATPFAKVSTTASDYPSGVFNTTGTIYYAISNGTYISTSPFTEIANSNKTPTQSVSGRFTSGVEYYVQSGTKYVSSAPFSSATSADLKKNDGTVYYIVNGNDKFVSQAPYSTTDQYYTNTKYYKLNNNQYQEVTPPFTKVDSTATYNSAITYYIIPENGNEYVPQSGPWYMKKTEDTTPQSGKTYYEFVNNTYTQVTSFVDGHEYWENKFPLDSYVKTENVPYYVYNSGTYYKYNNDPTNPFYYYKYNDKTYYAYSPNAYYKKSGDENTTYYTYDNEGKNVGDINYPWNTVYANTISDNDGIVEVGNAGKNGEEGVAQLIPAKSTESDLGTTEDPWDRGHITDLVVNSIKIGGDDGFVIQKGGSGSDDLGTGDLNYVTDQGLTDKIKVTNTNDGILYNNSDGSLPENYTLSKNDTTAVDTMASIRTAGGIYAEKNIWAQRVFNAVFNDYAEYRTTCEGVKPGQCVYDNDDGSLSISDGFLIPGAQIVSDTFGHAMGMNESCTTPIAVAGRVLAYPYGDRSKYHAGQSVCAAPNGTVRIMTRSEIATYPDCIVGIVSEIPDYETWGTDNVKVDGRIWIKVK